MSTLNSQIVQPTGDFHNQILIHVFSIAKHILDNTTPFDAIDDMFNNNTDAGNQPILLFLLWRQCFPWRFFLGLKRRYPVWIIPLKPCIFIEGDVGWKRRMFFISNLFVMTFALIGWAQVIDCARRDPTNKQMLDGVRFFLPL